MATEALSPAIPTPWSSPATAVLAAQGVDPERGLEPAEVAARRRRHGPNQLREMRRRSGWRILVDQFTSLLVGLLLLAAAVAYVFDERLEALSILGVIGINASIGFVTERRAVRSMEALRRLGSVAARVRREGREEMVPAGELVPGDVVLVEGGDVLTADLRLFEASKLEVDESSLTGESVPVAKGVEPVPRDTPVAGRSSLLFKGTAVTRGSAAGVVVATGMQTELGRISALVQTAGSEETPLEKRLEVLGRRLLGLTLVVAAAVGVAGLWGGRDVYLAIEIAIALAVATVPEGLPIVATVALARGMWRMARRQVLIERLSAVETLGSTSIILTDKTGTLTENRMTVVEVSLADGSFELAAAEEGGETRFLREGAAIEPQAEPALGEALRVAALCNNASLEVGEDGALQAVGDPMEAALLRAARAAGLERDALLERAPERREFAFDPDLKLMATLHGSRALDAAVKGAPEALVPRCTRQRGAAGSEPLDDGGRRRWLEDAEAFARRGLRVLAVARHAAPSLDAPPYQDLELLGLLALLDPPRERVREALERCRDAGLRVVMVTGDHGATAWTVAQAVGLVPRDAEPRIVDGQTLFPDGFLDPARERELLDATVIARASPSQKLDLIRLHQSSGAVVAMTGDGVNDAPALEQADIGVAMGQRGTQVAKEAADMVLQDDEFGSIVAAVAEGRAIFGNIRKFVVYLMSCNVSEILAVGAASLGTGPLPLLPLQILFLNLVTDVFPALALGVGAGGPGLMQQPPRDAREPILTRDHWQRILALGAVIAGAVLASLFLAHQQLGFDGRRATSVAFVTLALAQTWHVFNQREAGSGWLRNEITRNPWVWGAIGLCLGLLGLAIHLPPLAAVLSLSDPGLEGWLLALAFSAIPLAVGQLHLGVAAARRGAGRL